KYFSISLKGLKGGHSGIDIHLGRGNSNKIMARILYTLIKNTELNIVSFAGGNMRNAIPREAECIVAVKPGNEAALRDSISHFQNTLNAEFKKVEDDIELQLSEHEAASEMMSDSDSLRFISLIHACPNGVVRMSNEIKGLVETSVNLSIITMANGKVDMQLLIRSAMDSAKYALGDRLSALFELEGCEVTFGGDYPGWSPNSESYVLNIVKGSYEELYNKTPHINAVHAGLECGIIGGKYPNLDMVSFGPTIEHPHSPDEKAHIDSVGKFWDLLVKTLKNIN
ncbi:MAG: M20/M25/M40 family metallo-hydrolase, partial [Bacteroidales bacterium]|nr:M20/M25/M40 family metallo-hydrolase [Bacteroidales bacterium]